MNRGASRTPLLLAVLAVVALVGVVAVASTGSTPSGTGDGRPPADVLLDTFFSLALLLYLPAAALLLYGLLQRREIAREIASGRYRRAGVATYLVLGAFFALAVYFRRDDLRLDLRGGQGEVADVVETTRRSNPDGKPPGENLYEPEFAWIPVLVVVALAVLAIAAYVLSSRRRKALGAAEERAAEHVADTLEDTLDDLRAEPDPRRAVIAAFARLERALASSGLPRRAPETAEEYVARILDRLEVDRAPVRTLTDLFERAKFSQHEVTEAMREDAIAALTRIRDDLREKARRGEEQEEAPTARARAAAP
jgi:hypothetical protein